MAKTKPSISASVAARWYLIVVVSAIGGQGKTLFTELITLILRSLGHKVQAFSADVQRRLVAKLDGVIMLDTDLLDAAAEDPFALYRAFSPFSNAVINSVENGGSVVLDTAATWDINTLKFLRDTKVDEVVTANGGQLIIAAVTTSNIDAMRSMIASTKLVAKALPLARTMWVINERVGKVFPNNFDASLLDLGQEEFRQLRASVAEAIIPRMDDRLWQPVDRTPGLNLMKFVTARPSSLARLWPDEAGKPLDDLTAAVVQRRIATWIAAMMEAVTQAAGFSNSP